MSEFVFIPQNGAKYRYDYAAIARDLNESARDNDAAHFYNMISVGVSRDIFFLLYFVLNRVLVNRPWLVDRCYEVQDHHDRAAFFWARFHWKSSLANALRIQKIVNDPERRIGIFSFKRAISQAFLREMMQIFETNDLLKKAFPHVLYDNPKSQSPKWSEDAGIIVKRKSTAKESTVEAWGLVDNLPTSKHFTDQDFDDIVNGETVNTPDMVKKATDALKMAYLLMDEDKIKRTVWGTFYGFGDPNHAISKDKSWYRSIHSWRDAAGDFVLLNDETAEQLTADLTDWQISCQLDLNPVADSEKKFELAWLEYHGGTITAQTNRYILIDPARTKGEKSDYFAAVVLDVDNQRNYIVRAIVKDKLALAERWDKVKSLVKDWPNVKIVYYAKTAAEQDLEYFKEKMRDEGVFFRLEPLKETKNKVAEIEKLQPDFKTGRIKLPKVCWYDNINGERHDLVQEFIQEEYLAFPGCVKTGHDDVLNALAFIHNPDAKIAFPNAEPKPEERAWNPLSSLMKPRKRTSWMVA